MLRFKGAAVFPDHPVWPFRPNPYYPNDGVTHSGPHGPRSHGWVDRRSSSRQIRGRRLVFEDRRISFSRRMDGQRSGIIQSTKDLDRRMNTGRRRSISSRRQRQLIGGRRREK
jgi:hypothetical protein